MFRKLHVFTSSLFAHGASLAKHQSIASEQQLGLFCTAATEHAVGIDRHASKPRVYGQPTSDTHPHLLKKGEVTPGITADEYGTRRRRLMRAIDQYAQHSTLRARRHIVVVPSATKMFMSDKIPYAFRQNSDFFYLSGFLEPDSCLVLVSDDIEGRWSVVNDSGDGNFRAVLFVQPRDPHGELWDGPRTGREGAVDLLGVDEARDVGELPGFLGSYLRGSERLSVAFWYDLQNSVQTRMDAVLKRTIVDNSPKFINSPRSLIQNLRLIKSEAESRLMATSCEIASQAIARTIGATDPEGGSTEHLLHARVDYECRARGAERLAYPPVVAGGSRATTIHYVANTQRLAPGELVLMDAGCEYHGYVSDLTRTWPVSGTFSAPHRELYEAVLDVQTDLIRRCSERPSLDELFNNMIDLLGDRLRDVGVVERTANKADRNKAAHQYCPHHVGHFLGLDVHDTPLVPRSRALQPGMFITVEPGVYIEAEDRRVPIEFRGLGIRIEDNVLIKEDGIELLSKTCPKTVAELCQIRREQNENETFKV